MSSRFPPPAQEHPPKEVVQPTEAYRKAYKYCVLTSALLWKVELNDHNPVPVILVILALCCDYKMVIEWSQCGTAKNKFATLDYNIARLFAFGAILVSVVQYGADLQVVNFWKERFYSSEQRATLEQIVFIGIALFVSSSITGIRRWKDFGWLKRIITVLSILVSLYLCLVLRRIIAGSRGYVFDALALTIGAFLAAFPRFVLSRIQNTAAENGRYSVVH